MRIFDYSALAKRTWNMDVLTLVAKIHEYKGRQVLFVRQKPAELDRLIDIARIQNTESPNKIEGIVITATEVGIVVNRAVNKIVAPGRNF